MTKLATIEDVRAVIRFDDIEELNNAIASALEVATVALESGIRTSFARRTGADVFFIKPNEVSPSLFEYHWRLTDGYVDSGQPFKVEMAYAYSDFGLGTATDITANCIIDYTKGLVSYLGGAIFSIRTGVNKLDGNFVKVSYTCGFNLSAVQGEEDLYSGIPENIKQAAILKAIVHLDTVSPTLRHEKNSAYDPKAMNTVYSTIIQKVMRYYPKYSNPAVKSS